MPNVEVFHCNWDEYQKTSHWDEKQILVDEFSLFIVLKVASFDETSDPEKHAYHSQDCDLTDLEHPKEANNEANIIFDDFKDSLPDSRRIFWSISCWGGVETCCWSLKTTAHLRLTPESLECFGHMRLDQAGHNDAKEAYSSSSDMEWRSNFHGPCKIEENCHGKRLTNNPPSILKDYGNSSSWMVNIVVNQGVSKLNLSSHSQYCPGNTHLDNVLCSVGSPNQGSTQKNKTYCNHQPTAKKVIIVADEEWGDHLSY